MGKVGEGKNPTHQLKKLDTAAIREFRDRFAIPIPDDDLEEVPYFKPAEDSPEMKYLHEHRRALGGYLPQRRRKADEKLAVPALDAFQAVLEPTAEGREISTTQAFVRSLTQLVRDKAIGPRVVPIIPDEARTFGMEGMFRQLGIYASQGQLYEPVDKDQVMYYREDKAGQILEEGINEAGAMSSWIAAATSYSHTNRISIPFYIFYSMFGFQRIGDLAWAAGDCQTRGFLLGATAGRTTLNGEGLQHQDGHSHLMSLTIPNCVSYDPTFAHEVAVILQAGLKRMIEDQENVWYYVTLMNENYPQPGLTKGQEAGILKGMYRLQEGPAGSGLGRSIPRVQLLGSGTILREAIAAADLLWNDWGVAGDVWSVTSFTELRREGIDVERWNLLHPGDKPRKAYVTQQLEKTVGPIVATTDYKRLFADQIRPFLPRGRDYRVLGTDGFGRSDTRAKLREFFEVDRHYVVLSALRALADEGMVPAAKVGRSDQEVRHRPEQAESGDCLDAARRHPRRRRRGNNGQERAEEMGQQVEVKVPDIGDFKEVEVIEVLVKPGDTVAKEQSLVTVESDKASMEIPSSAAGVVKELKIKLGDKVSEGTLLLVLDAAAGAAAPAAAAAAPRRRRHRRRRRAPAPAPAPAAGGGSRAGSGGGERRRPWSNAPATSTPRWARDPRRSTSARRARRPHASPSVRKFARELGVDLQHVAGSGPKGRITPDDVREHVKAVMASGARPAAAPAAVAAPGPG